MEEKNTVPAAIPPAGTEDIPTRKDRRPIIIAVAAVTATVLAVGGVCGYRAYEHRRVSLARQACASAVADQSKAVKSYKALLGADATTAALKTDVKAVKDAKTLDALKRAVGAETPAMVKCDASDKNGLDEATAKADKTARSVKADAKTLRAAVRAVESSKLDKTVADADGLYRATEGKVQDEKTRENLAKAVKARDADAIGKAVKAVNDSKAAKEKADAEAKAKAEQEAAAQAAAAAQQAQQQAQAQRSYSSGSSNGSYSSNRWAGSTGGQSYSGGSQSSGFQGGSTSSGGSDDYDITQDPFFNQHTTNPSCASGGFCPIG
ncbi:hypothetical protein [uncultured Bifidobacterium sp.]|uniref:hypothetical protein n=1 Tax=uncultured Bifidobacterium sp. TaxID=165187 RepID=UPI002589EEF1|nr:hypothetical protein [uncultured Bifidobacterium sp.]